MKTQKSLAILFLASLTLSACSQHKGSERATRDSEKVSPGLFEKYFDSQNSCFRSGIVGGSKVTAENPRKKHVALIMASTEHGEIFVCTAVLLTKSILLTAAHCAEANSIQAFFHHSSMCSDGMNKSLAYSVKKVVVHPYWNENPNTTEPLRQANNDLALLKLEKNAPLSYQPVELASPQEIETDSEIVQIGYGKPSTQATEPPILREVFKKKKDIEYLDYSHYLSIKQSSQGGCSGDSGGPLLVKNNNSSYKVAGIASFLTKPQTEDTICETGTLAYVSVIDYIPWIQETLKLLK